MRVGAACSADSRPSISIDSNSGNPAVRPVIAAYSAFIAVFRFSSSAVDDRPQVDAVVGPLAALDVLDRGGHQVVDPVELPNRVDRVGVDLEFVVGHEQELGLLGDLHQRASNAPARASTAASNVRMSSRSP